jgi:hypothetical protein
MPVREELRAGKFENGYGNGPNAHQIRPNFDTDTTLLCQKMECRSGTSIWVTHAAINKLANNETSLRQVKTNQRRREWR